MPRLALRGSIAMTAPSWKAFRDDPSAIDDSSDSQSQSSDDSDGKGDSSCGLHHSLGTPVIRYRPDVDGLRAIAVIGVAMYHLNERWFYRGRCVLRDL